MVENQILVQQTASSNPHKEFLVNYAKNWYPTKKNLYSITIIIFVEKGQLAPASMMVFDIKNLDRKKLSSDGRPAGLPGAWHPEFVCWEWRSLFACWSGGVEVSPPV